MSRLSESTGFYKTQAWKNTQRNYKQSVGGLCERCLARGIIEPAEIVHHKIPLTADNIKDLDISLGHNNLLALCRKCHAEVHKSKANTRYNIDNNGKVTINDGII